jgi:hypothetical protein
MPELPIPPPDTLPLPMPFWAIKALLLLTFGAHIAAVDVGVGGTILCAFHAWRGRPDDMRVARRLAGVLAPAVTFVITLGVAPLLFVQLVYGPFFYTATVLTALPWLALIFLLMGGYGLLYRFTYALAADRVLIASGVGAALLLLGVGFVLVNATTLSLRPDLWAGIAAASPHGGALNFGDATLLPRFAHMLTAMCAMAGLFLAAWGAFIADGEPERRMGLTWFFNATLVQAAAGPLLLFLQPPAVRSALLGGSLRGTLALWPAIALAVAALVFARRAMAPGAPARAALVPVVLGGTTALGMVVARDAARDAALAVHGFDPWSLPYKTDAVSLAVFAAALAAYVAVAWVLVRWAAAPAREVAHGG